MGKRLICIYFSATDTTRKYVKAFSEALCQPIDININLADDLSIEMPEIGQQDMVVVAAPVYGGRLPSQVASRLKELNGSHAKAVAMVVYGNRAYDDALLELTDILKEANFDILGAGAFIGQHSIFPKVAALRPDDQDFARLNYFAGECKRLMQNGSNECPDVKGKRPYKKAGGVPLHPSGNSAECNRCGKCVEHCPVEAIRAETPYLTDGSRCMSCGRCIMICPKHTRRYSGMKYKLIGAIFAGAFSKRKEPEFSVK